MDKNAIKKYAIWARRELIARVSQKAEQYGITEKEIIDEHAEKIQGVVLTPAQVRQRQTLIQLIRRDGYQQAMEEVAYTWFNRFIALRFMEVNDYLPGHTCVFTDDQNAFKPKILSDALHLELPGMSMDKVIELKEANKTEELYQYLLITLCNYLNTILPGMFQRIDDYTELLFPEHLLREGSVLEQLVTMIPREDWLDAVQIIGWLYQYYNAEPKDLVFANLKKNIKISKESIPAATQLFTPDWIVRYMVENSLGRLWVEGHPNDNLKSGWKYYLEEAEQEPEVQAQLQTIREQYAQMKPEEIRCIDPCMGSGHILVYLFDVLVQIYEAYGYPTREAVASIVQNNLWGLDIDDRAAQLAYFAVMMKARQYDKGWFRRGIGPHVFALQDSVDWSAFERRMRQALANHQPLFEDAAIKVAKTLFDTFADAKEYGSIIQPDVTLDDLDMLGKVLDGMQQHVDLMDMAAQADAASLMETLNPMILQCRALVQKYYVVVTNPPYMGNMPVKMTEYVRKYYSDEKYDLYAVFVKKAFIMAKPHGYVSMITQQAWMFLASFNTFRNNLQAHSLINLLHLGARAFDEISGEVVQTVTFTFLSKAINEYQGNYLNLLPGNSESAKEELFFTTEKTIAKQSIFSLIPGNIFAYWVSPHAISLFKGNRISNVAIIKSGIVSGNNDYFLRLWHEIDWKDIGFHHKKFTDNSDIKWVPMHKGGGYRKHYGLHEYVMNLHDIWEPDKTNESVRRGEPNYYFKEGLTWSTLSTNLSVRQSPIGFVFDTKGSMCFPQNYDDLSYLEGLLNSTVASFYMGFLSPTLDFSQAAMAKIPFISDNKYTERITELSNQCVQESKADWDSFESSWDFIVHPIVRWSRNLRDATSIGATMDYYYGYKPEVHSSVELCYMLWQGECNDRFRKLKSNEEELNRIFIDIYGLQDKLTPEVADKDVTVRKADLSRDIRSLVSYAVGCMLGRFSIYKGGLMFAGGEWSEQPFLQALWDHLGMRYVQTESMQPMMDLNPQKVVVPDLDGILPITDDDYFDDDIVTMFINWVKIVFGSNDLEENLIFIASALYPNGGGTARELIRQYFLNDFYKDHLKIYQKRPIYWLFDAGRKNSFKCLIYLHRYRPDTVARVRTDYVHEMQARYRTAMDDLAHRMETAGGSERVRLQKQLAKIQGQEEELRKYEEKIHHYADMMLPLDLDDGVKVNYAKLADVLAPIK